MEAKPLSWYTEQGLEPTEGAPILCANPDCGATFAYERKRSTRQYCNKLCWERHRRQKNRPVFPPRVCVVCGKEFIPTQGKQVACPGACRALRPRRRSNSIDLSRNPEQLVAESVERERLAMQQAKIEQALRERTALEIISQTIKTAVKALPPVESVPPLPECKAGFEDEDVVLLISDVHLGLEINPDEMGGVGGYNYQIFQDYLANLAKAVAEIHSIHSRAYNLPRLHVWFLGDLVEGTQVYRGQAHHLEMTVVEQLFEGVQQLAVFVSQMQQIFPAVSVRGVVGNHGRVGRKGDEKRYVNWDYVLYKTLELMMKDQPRVQVGFPVTFWDVAEVRGHDFLLLHGDNIRAWMGVPWYGIQRAVANFREVLLSIDQRFEYICLGHFHNTGEIESSYGEKLINGSWPGATPYGVEQLFQSARPRQLLFGVNPRRGISWRYWLDLRGHGAIRRERLPAWR